MKPIIIIIGASVVLALLTAAEAAPLYLRCDGKVSVTNEPITYNVKIDGKEVTIENYPPVPVDDDLDEVLSFGLKWGYAPFGYINRYTGHATIAFDTPGTFKTPRPFEGVCRKAEKLFRHSRLGRGI
jgi:hypothetical protein